MLKKVSLIAALLFAFAINSNSMAQNIDITKLSQSELNALMQSQKGLGNSIGNTNNKNTQQQNITYKRNDANSENLSIPTNALGEPPINTPINTPMNYTIMDYMIQNNMVVDSLTMDSLLRAQPYMMYEVPVFGRDIFKKENLTFAPSYSIPTPQNYIVSAGDKLIIELWGSSEASYNLEVSPEGGINIPQVGIIYVNGLTIEEAESKVRSTLSNLFSGIDDSSVYVKVGLGDIRSIRVNVIGEAFQPGTYTLPSLSTMFNALYIAGGVSDIGSLRNIKLYRNGTLVSNLDVYDYLIDGRTDVDMRLEDGDMIVIAPYENIVTIEGEAKRVMKYEMTKGESAETAVEYAGGFTGKAYTSNISLTREAGGKQHSIHTIMESELPSFLLMDGDKIVIGKIIDEFENRVTIEGAVYRPGDYEISDKASTVKELIELSDGVTPYAFMARGQIVRTNPDKTLQVIPFNVGKLLLGAVADIELIKDDKVFIANINDLKESQFVEIKGEVNNPQVLAYADNMTLEDVILMASGLKNSASLARVEVSRRIKDADALEAGDTRAEFYTFTISEDLELSEETSNFTLMPYDEVFIRRSPSYQVQASVFVDGEANFPGEYTMESSFYTLADLVKAAGGATNQAYLRGAVLYRKYTDSDFQRLRAVEKLANVANREQKAMSDAGEVSAIDDSNLAQVGDTYSVGIDLEAALTDPNGLANLTLREGDLLNIPVVDNTVSIMGAVYYHTSTTYNPNLSVRDYIKMAGDYSELAKRKPFVIFMNGDIKTLAVSSKKLEPGCRIVIPYKAYSEPMSAQGWVSVATSVVSMAAMITSLLNYII